VAKALVNKGYRLGQLDRSEEEIAVYDEVVRRFGERTEPGLAELVAKALVNKGYRLGQLDRSEEEIAVYDEVVRRYENVETLVIRSQVSNAKNSLGFTLLTRIKAQWEMVPDHYESLNKAYTHFREAMTDSGDQPMVLGNIAYTLFLMGRRDEAEAQLRTALQNGGERLKEGELADTEMHSVPEDEDFRALVVRLWEEIGAQPQCT
jgi:tetratricopeptide (TPR) repeat protein